MRGRAVRWQILGMTCLMLGSGAWAQSEESAATLRGLAPPSPDPDRAAAGPFAAPGGGHWLLGWRLHSDLRTQGVSSAQRSPGLTGALAWAHDSGWLLGAELALVDGKKFFGQADMRVSAGVLWRRGASTGWRTGLGLGGEFFPGAGYTLPMRFDAASGVFSDWRGSNFNTRFAVLELGYRQLDVTWLYTLSRDYYGSNRSSVCAVLLAAQPDPGEGLRCYAEAGRHSRGSWVLRGDYTLPLNEAGTTALRLHAGYQRVRGVPYLSYPDFGVELLQRWQGLKWVVRWERALTRRAALHSYTDGGRLKRADDAALIFSVGTAF